MEFTVTVFSVSLTLSCSVMVLSLSLLVCPNTHTCSLEHVTVSVRSHVAKCVNLRKMVTPLSHT